MGGSSGEEYEEAGGDEYEEIGAGVAADVISDDDDEEVVLGDCGAGRKRQRCAGEARRVGGSGAGGRHPRGTGEEYEVEGFTFEGVGGDVEEEEDRGDDEKADRDMQMLQEACLPVSGAPLPPSSGPPKDADEYLRQVQWERLHCPEVVEADVKEKPPNKDHPRRKQRGVGGGLLARLNISEAFADEGVQYSAEWKSDAVAAFRDLRESCDVARQGTPGFGQTRLTFVAWRDRLTQGGRPSTGMLIKQNFVSINRLVVVAVELLVDAERALGRVSGNDVSKTGDAQGDDANDNDDEPTDVNSAAAAAANEAAAASPKDRRSAFETLDRYSEWAFSALSFLELPLVDDVQFQMQRLRRSCHKLLALSRDSSALEAEADSEGRRLQESLLARASLLLIIVTEVFGQR